MLRAFFHLLLRLCFRFRAYGTEVLQTPGPVLLVPNHVSWIDFLFLWVLMDLDWKFVVSSIAARYSWVHRLIMINRRTFPIDPASAYAVKRMAEYLQKGGRLVLFAEGQLTRTGSLMKLFDGTGFLLHKTRAKVVTAYLRGANRLRWSRQPGWRRWWPEITLHFSPVLDAPACTGLSTSQARTKLTTWLRDQMVQQHFATEMAFGPASLPEAIVAMAGAQPRKVVLEDATMTGVTYRRLLVGADLLGGRLAARVPPDTTRVGVLLPNVNALPVVLLGLWTRGLTPAILNFTTGIPTMLTCARLAGLKQIVTSRVFLERAKLHVEPLTQAGIEIIHLEDVRAGIGRLARLAAAARLYLAPKSLLRHGFTAQGRAGNQVVQPRAQAPRRESPMAKRQAPSANGQAPTAEQGGGVADSAPGVLLPSTPGVILFTSGSEGVPKGVELTQRNLLANIRQMLAVVDLTDADRVFNALPIFHSFGLTVGTLLGLVRGLYVFLYPSPLHYRVIPNVLYDRHCTVFLSTNTFLNGYARKAHPYDFRSMRYLFAAAEKVQEDTMRTWMQRYGVRLLEGYGATECSPALSVNLPIASRPGSVGRLLPGIEMRLEAVEGIGENERREEDAAASGSRVGRLFVRGPNVMRGYLNGDADAKFQALGGWYDTGDIVSVDEDGFLSIRGRLKRFAKVSGEMVSLTAVEDALAGAFPQHGPRCEVAIITRPDADKGEVLIAVTNASGLRPEELREAIRAKGLPNLCVPREVRFLKEIPKLGTGKVNHRELAALVA